MTMRLAMSMTTQLQDIGIEAIGAAITGSSAKRTRSPVKPIRTRSHLAVAEHSRILSVIFYLIHSVGVYELIAKLR